ncbi:MAG: gliding motility-associated protein GldE [Cyclobacteriaceae bacterium]|nr:gliding motility-associated protein GldE [Cyclobacteriaceae bacterium]UYN86815.1 MAG: gliding motility-associated protein GldE [Cyclobacteriaceae bacterium]
MDEPPSYTLLQLLSGLSLMHLISIAVIAMLLIISGLVSGSEVAFFSLKPEDLDRCRESEERSDKTILELLGKPRQLLATILIMNNTVNVGIVTLATFLMWELSGTRRPEEIIVGVVTFVIAFVLTFFGEIVPKVYATKNNLSFARFMAAGWRVLIVICKPISAPLMTMSNFVERRVEKKGYQTTVEELNQALELATSTDETSAEEKEILRGIVNFGTLSVRQVMRSRVDISAVDSELNFFELMEFINKSGFSRLPVYRESLDKIEGLLYIKDLLPYLDQDAGFAWQKLLRTPFFVPETKKVDSLLKDFQEKRIHMALVVDEYGGTAGLITLEDVIEEIIGEINDEFDEAGLAYQKIDEHTFAFEGKTSLHDFCKALDVEPNTFDEIKGESESLGGVILEINKGFPKAGDQIQYNQFTFTIEAVDKKRIKRVKVHVHEQKSL